MLTSPSNPSVAAAARLKKRALRETDRRFLVEGRQGVEEAAAAGSLLELFTLDPMDPLVVAAKQAGAAVHHVQDDLFRKLTETVTPQGIVGVAPFVDVDLAALPREGCVTVLYEVRDPGNAGTIIRSADAAGASGVVFGAASVDVYNPKAVRASAGSIFHVPIVRDAADPIPALRANGFRILALDAHRGEDLYTTDLSAPVALVFGNEAHGLPDEVLASADGLVRVPHTGPAESLNLAAAVTVCLFEWARRRAYADSSMEAIVAAAAHDIRSPLTAIKGFGYALGRRWSELSEDDRTMMLGGIVHDADRMEQVLRLLVDAARSMGGRLEFFPELVDVSELVLGVAEHLRHDPGHPSLDWGGDAVMAFVDPTRLKTAMLVFAESLVWWGREGPIAVRAAMTQGDLHLWAERGGASIGIDEAELLFAPRQPGTGSGSKIGLFVVRAVADAQGGRAWAEVDGDRLSFHLLVPAVAPAVV